MSAPGSGTFSIWVWPTNCMSAECTARIARGSMRSLAISASPLDAAGREFAHARLVQRGDRLVDGLDEIVPEVRDDAA